MTTIDKEQKRYFARALLAFSMFCLVVLASCGTAPHDRPFLTNTDVPTQQAGTPTSSTGSQLVPITVQSQSQLTSYPGGTMSLSISTSPYVVAQFVVYYGLSTPSKALGIIPRTTNAQGVASWSWQVNLAAHTGTWPLKIIATAPGGTVATQMVNATLSLPPISLVSSQSTLTGYPKDTLTLAVATAPLINCNLLLNFGPGVVNKTLYTSASGKGIAIWSWRLDKASIAGKWPMRVTIVLPDGESTSTNIYITVL